VTWIIAGILLVGFIGFLIWFARNPIVLVSIGPRKTVLASAVPEAASAVLKVTMTLTGTQDTHTITEICLPRPLAQALGVRAPGGFSEQPLSRDGGFEDDPETVKFVETYNRDTLRWVGSFPFPPGQPVTLVIPAQTPSGSTGSISFQYEWKGKVAGGSINFFTAAIANQ
jgi:hypothetical protein